MSEILRKPYEISIWGEHLETSEGVSYYKENKIAVIGSNTMATQNRVYSPVLHENVNGETTLTFSLKYRYFDEDVGDFVVNPFTSFLVNERKVKLYYNNKWYEFLIKERQESSEDYTFTYTATDAFINELSKTGYNVEFDTALNNNQGTVIELAKEALKNTDWIVDEEHSDLLRQLISEPIYLCQVTSGNFNAKNLDTDEDVLIDTDEYLYIFYSYLVNKETKYIQFLRLLDKDSWKEDNNGSYIGTNYRILQDITYEETENQQYIVIDEYTKINIQELHTLNQGHRLVYNQKTTYDPVMQKTVDIYQANYGSGTQDIYHYDDYVYSTSAVVVPIITCGSNFTTFSLDATPKGWSNATSSQHSKLQDYSLITFPKIDVSSPLMALEDLHKVVDYLELEYPTGAGTWDNNFANAFFNTGFTDSASTIGSIARGEKYVFRIRYKFSSTKVSDISNTTNATINNASIRAVIAGYRNVKRTLEDGTIITVKEVVPSQIYFNFDDNFKVGNNYIRGGIIENNNYYIDKVAQVPSMQYIYETEDDQGKHEWVWDADNSEFIPYDNNFNNYLYVIAEAQKGLSQAEVQDINNRIGIFVYDDDAAAKYVYIEDIQIFPFVADGDTDIPVLPGNAPVAESHITPYYYLKPNNNVIANQITTYTSLDTLADGLGIPKDDITALRNEKCEKVLSINVNKSNYFNILQTLCETFECWVDINVEHDINGRIKLDKNFKPIKKIVFKEYIGKDNFAGFRYGINLNSISRTVDSNEIVSKLIVGQTVSDYINSGVLSITDSTLNENRESYILNLNYYINHKLIDNKEDCLQDIQTYNNELAVLNTKIQQKEQEKMMGLLGLNKLDVQRHVFIELVEQAQDTYVKALNQFQQVTNTSYEQYRQTHPDDTEIFKQSSIQEIIGEIYSSAAVDNSYGGMVSSLNTEYKNLELMVKGAQTYSIIASTTKGENGQEDSTKITVSHYVDGLVCKLFSDTAEPEIFIPSINKQEYSVPHIYNKLVVTSIPTNYQVSYNINGQIVTVPENSQVSFDIYDSENDCGLVKRFSLVPTEEYTQKYPGYDKEIEELLKQKQEKENDFNSKYGRFIKEGTWESTDYINPDLYYLDALQVSNVSAQPRVTYEIKVTEISSVEDYKNYTFALGDKTYVEDIEFFGYKTIQIGFNENATFIKTPIQEEVVVSQIEWHLDEPDQNIITVQNYKTQFEDLFQRISAAVQSVQINTPTYMRAANILDENGQIKASILANSLNQLGGATYGLAADGLVRVVDDGLLVQNLTSPENLLIIRSRGIDISTDGGVKWTTILSPEGINANEINTGVINTNKILLMDGENPSFRWDKSGLNAYGYGDNGYDLKTYVRFDKYGLYGIKDGNEYEYNNLNEIKDNAHFGLTWDGFFIKNNYTNGYVSISSDNDFQVIRNINGQKIEKIKIGALDFGAANTPTRYGINIRNDNGEVVFTTGDDGNLTITGTINARAGNIGGMTVNEDSLQMGTICLEPHNGIYSTTLVKTASHPIYEYIWHETEEGQIGYFEVIDTGETEDEYGPAFFISDVDGSVSFNNAQIRGEINAGSGNFYGKVSVGKDVDNEDKSYIEIDGVNSMIKTSDFSDGAGRGWKIDKDGNAYFYNITARGAIKTAVFEYAEIQAVGGIFIFRPSSTIKGARLDGNNLILRVEKPSLFTKLQNQEYSWCKISNYTTDGTEPDVNNILLTNGLTHVYQISNVNLETAEVTLENGMQFVNAVRQLDETITDVLINLEGGALVDMGRTDGSSNYGIGINSSDNTVNLPRRAISLFETEVDSEATETEPKITYNYRGILGTLPELGTKVNSTIYDYNMKDTQGIFTDNMYIGDRTHYIAFYTDKNDDTKKLRIAGADIVFTYDDGEGGTTEKTLDERIDEIEAEGGEDAAVLVIDSSEGNVFRDNQGQTDLTVTIFYGASVIINKTQLTQAFGVSAYLEWEYKDNTNNWVTLLSSDPRIDNNGFTIHLSAANVYSKANFRCKLVV